MSLRARRPEGYNVTDYQRTIWIVRGLLAVAFVGGMSAMYFIH